MNRKLERMSGRWSWMAAGLALMWSIGGGAAKSSGAEAGLDGGGGAPLDVEAIVSAVVESHPELGFYRAEMAAAKAGRRAAGALADPEVTAAVGNKHVRGVGDGVAWSVSAQQTFEWPGRVGLRKAIANQEIRLAELGLAQFRAGLAARTRALAVALQAAREKAAAAREVAERFQALREVLVQRDPAGLTPALETRIVEATELTMHRRVSEAATAEQAALLELNQLRGRSMSEPVSLKPLALALPPAPDDDVLRAAALTNQFDLQLRRAELEQQGFKVALARNERKPSFTVGPYVTQERTGDRETQVGLGVTVPLPLWSRNRGGVELAEARREQASTSMRMAERQVEREVLELALRYRAKRAEMNKWRPDSVAQFREAANLADRHYRLGAVPIATYVELQKQYLEAVEALLDTRTEALEAGQRIELLTGLSLAITTAAERPEAK